MNMPEPGNPIRVTEKEVGAGMQGECLCSADGLCLTHELAWDHGL